MSAPGLPGGIHRLEETRGEAVAAAVGYSSQ